MKDDHIISALYGFTICFVSMFPIVALFLMTVCS